MEGGAKSKLSKASGSTARMQTRNLVLWSAHVEGGALDLLGELSHLRVVVLRPTTVVVILIVVVIVIVRVIVIVIVIVIVVVIVTVIQIVIIVMEILIIIILLSLANSHHTHTRKPPRQARSGQGGPSLLTFIPCSSIV